MQQRPMIIADQIGYIRDITSNAVNKLPPIQCRPDTYEYENMCQDCNPLMSLCDRCSLARTLYDIDIIVYFSYTKLSTSNRQQYVDYILQKLDKLDKLDDTTYVKDMIQQLSPFVEFVNLYTYEVNYTTITFDALIMSYINGYYEYIIDKYLTTLRRYNIDICRIWYTSIFDVTNMYSILLTITLACSSFPSIDYRELVDTEFELCKITIHYMVESAQETPHTTLEIPKCFTIKMLLTHAIEYGFGKDGMKSLLFIEGDEDPIDNNIEINELEKKDLFCLYEVVST